MNTEEQEAIVEKTETEHVKSRLTIMINEIMVEHLDVPAVIVKSFVADSLAFNKLHHRLVERALNKYAGGFVKTTHYLQEPMVFKDKLVFDSFDVYCPSSKQHLIEMANTYSLTEDDIARAFPKENKVEPEADVFLLKPSEEALEEAEKKAELVEEDHSLN